MSRTGLRDRSSCCSLVTRVEMRSIATLLCGRVKLRDHWEGVTGMDVVRREDLLVRGLPKWVI